MQTSRCTDQPDRLLLDKLEVLSVNEVCVLWKKSSKTTLAVVNNDVSFERARPQVRFTSSLIISAQSKEKSSAGNWFLPVITSVLCCSAHTWPLAVSISVVGSVTETWARCARPPLQPYFSVSMVKMESVQYRFILYYTLYPASMKEYMWGHHIENIFQIANNNLALYHWGWNISVIWYCS